MAHLGYSERDYVLTTTSTCLRIISQSTGVVYSETERYKYTLKFDLWGEGNPSTSQANHHEFISNRVCKHDIGKRWYVIKLLKYTCHLLTPDLQRRYNSLPYQDGKLSSCRSANSERDLSKGRDISIKHILGHNSVSREFSCTN